MAGTSFIISSRSKKYLSQTHSIILTNSDTIITMNNVMSIFSDYSLVSLPLIVVLALLSLVSIKPSLTALFLFIQSIIINIYLAINFGITSSSFASSILLTFFIMIIIGTNSYFTISFHKATTQFSKTSLVLGLLFLLLYVKMPALLPEFLMAQDRTSRLLAAMDTLSLVIWGFGLFAILMCSLLIFDLKNSKSGDPYEH